MDADEGDGWNFFQHGKNKKTDKRDANKTGGVQEHNQQIKTPDGVKISRPTQDRYYDNSHPNIGLAIIFNHKTIRGQTPRRGTDKDRKRIKAALRSYGFDVQTYDDLEYADIVDVLAKASQADHSKNDCLVVVVMSHGIEGQIYAQDMAYPIDKLWTPFLGENCKSLLNKPKLFFIQACRGDKVDPGATYTEETFKVMTRSIGEDQVDSPSSYTIPNTADLLIFYSTFEGHFSWRNPINGSWFMQSVADSFEEYVDEEFDFYHFLTDVNRKVAYEYQSNVPNDEKLDEMKAMPNFVSTLTKIFIMKAKP